MEVFLTLELLENLVDKCKNMISSVLREFTVILEPFLSDVYLELSSFWVALFESPEI